MARRRLDREAAERVLRRAVELSDTDDGDDGFDLELLVEAAGDLGVPGTAVQRAAAEEQAGLLSTESSRVDRYVGPAAISAARVVPGTPSGTMDLADGWLRRQWAFRRVRAGDTVAEYRRRTDMVASMQRTAKSVSGNENGDKIRNLRVVARSVGDPAGGDGAGEEHTVVAVVVDLESSRSFAEMGGAVVAGGGSLLSAIPVIGSGTLWALLGIPTSAAMGVGVLAARKAWTGGIDVALEGLLDRIEAGEPPPSVIGGIAGRIKPGSTRRQG